MSTPRLRTSLAVSLMVVLPALLTAQGHEDWSYNLAVYEVNIRQYTPEGTFAAFETHLDRLQDLGVGILWFMPVHPIGVENRLGSLGSYYSVRDYLDVNPEYGTLDDFKRLVDAIHDRGMYVMIDWVANHTAWDNVLTIEHPEWYSRDAGGNFISPPGTNWSDVIDLDYEQSGLREYMIDAMIFWLEEVGVDGFRCDAVSFVPPDFWREAISTIKAQYPDVLMLAEGDGRQWHDVGFDITHGWGLYGFGNGVLKGIADRTYSAANLNGYATSERIIYDDDAYRMYFTSNHDENSWHGTTRELFGEAAEAFAVLTATFNGLPLIYSGQEAGLDKRLRFFDKDVIDWLDHPNWILYQILLDLKRRNQALWNGRHGGELKRILTDNNTDGYIFERERAGQRVLVALNLSDREQTFMLAGASFSSSYRDVFTGQTTTLEEGATLTLASWGYAVYEATGVNTNILETGTEMRYALDQNYPNPFRDWTRISFTLKRPDDIQVQIFDVHGRLIDVLVSQRLPAGSHSTLFRAAKRPSGVYLYRIAGEGWSETKRLIVSR